MEFFAPEQGVCDEEVSDLVTAEVENERAPILMSALAGIFVFVEGGAVVVGEGP